MTYHLGLIGFPLGHSLSPKIHTAALADCGLAGDYTLFPVLPDDQPALAALLNRLRAGDIHGLNVTIPHKQNIIPLLDGLTETAQAIGAVNTISLCNGQLIGDNTDAPGFLSDLNRFLASRGLSSTIQKHGLVLGAGGSARAVVYALVKADWKVTIAARRAEQGRELAESLKYARNHNEILTLDDFDPSMAALIVNTTPLGMFPNVETSPWPVGIPFPGGAVVYDLVYNPRETRLAREARAAGLAASTGLGMLIEQAALAFEIWTGLSADREVLRASVEA